MTRHPLFLHVAALLIVSSLSPSLLRALEPGSRAAEVLTLERALELGLKQNLLVENARLEIAHFPKPHRLLFNYFCAEFFFNRS